ncbi:hypothetical protein F7725_010581 [Dissostichus mawsoni]|uniref:Solute carrier family 49 member A3 n=1 Tax=Dissostichus mawsoni TaxID=36200 RepID=A0A7J5XPN9_DISMA|nr:hypothetical protein F7725_010581 [Dissostichus mawsoni]
MEGGDENQENRPEVQTVGTGVIPGVPNTELKKLLSFKVYKRRWFVLLVLCLLNCSNATLWLSFAPVADQSARYLQVGLEQVNWLSIIYMIVAIPLSFATSWMLDVLGLRITLILGAWLNMFGALVRFLGTGISTDPAARFPLVMFGQTLAAIAQPLVIFTPAKMAALWFPDNQRATANTIGSMVGLRSSSPPTPPSASAESSGSEPFVQGIKLLLKNRAYLVLMLCFGSGIAAFTCFSTLLEQILCVQGYSNEFAGVCGALFIVFGIVGAGALGLIVDKTKKFIEATKINLSLSAVACIAFSVVSLMPQQKVAVAVVCSLFGFFGFSIYPVAMELAVECTYPVGEATSSGLIFVSGADAGAGGADQRLLLRLRHLLQHEVPPAGGEEQATYGTNTINSSTPESSPSEGKETAD